MNELKIAMLVRQFSPHGGLELYAHKVVEGLLANGVAVTVVCQEKESELQDRCLDFKMISPAGQSGGKHARISNLFHNANLALAQLDHVDLIHSQHCPANNADLVTFHNHSSRRLSEVGLWWEKLLNDNKRRLVPTYRMRDEHDEALLRRALCLIFPAEVMKEDFYSAFPFLQGPPSKPYVVAHPGASMSGKNAKLISVKDADSDSGKDSGKDSNLILGRDANLISGRDSDSKLTLGSDEAFTFLFVGRGFRKKGLDVLFSACCLLRRRGGRKFRLLIAGLSAKAADKLRLSLLGLQDCVSYLGFQKDMDAVYARAHSIILPSRVEPFGMAPVQAMQRGLVPIVSRVSGVAEVLHDGQDSLILNDHLNAEELANLMSQLMNEPELLRRLSTSALITAEKVSWEETVNQTLKAYEIALSLKKSSEKSLSK